MDLKLEIKISHGKLWSLLLYEFRLGHKAMGATSSICGTMDEDALFVCTAQHWFHRFKSGNFELDDLPHIGRPLQVDIDLLKQLIENNPRLAKRFLVEWLEYPFTAVETYLNELGKTRKYGVLMSYWLSPLQLQHRASVCIELLTSHCN